MPYSVQISPESMVQKYFFKCIWSVSCTSCWTMTSHRCYQFVIDGVAYPKCICFLLYVDKVFLCGLVLLCSCPAPAIYNQAYTSNYICFVQILHSIYIIITILNNNTQKITPIDAGLPNPYQIECNLTLFSIICQEYNGCYIIKLCNGLYKVVKVAGYIVS